MRSTTHSSPGLSAQQLWLRDAELLLASEAEAEGEGEATPSPPPEDRRKLARRRPGVAARRPGLALKIGRRTKSESTELTGHGRHGRHAMILAGADAKRQRPPPIPLTLTLNLTLPSPNPVAQFCREAPAPPRKATR